ncbi:cystatin-like [Conger conger]|uniref:cystatin-like n=1 Tax=Conger conger TaxID=82655 RepID=UPI002A5A8CF5|nr:cystatin-like [Conger conger]
MTAIWKIAVPLLAVFFAVASAGMGMTGGLSEADLESAPVKDALQFAVLQYNRGNNAMYQSKMTKLIKAQQQVVAGMKYFFTVELSMTSCRKNVDLKQCEVHKDPAMAAPKECVLTVWSRSWLNEMELTKTICK